MRLLLVLAALLATAYAISLGSDKCTWGPSYWCSSVTAAGRCSAFAHCLQGVWSKTLVDFLQTETCTTSVNKVQLARRLLVTKNEKDSAAQILTSLCTFVTDSERRKECKEMVVMYLPLALELLTSNLKDDQVAWVFGLCEQARSDVAPVKYQPSAEETRCKNCYSFVTDITARLGKDGGEKLQGVLKSAICRETGNMGPMCKLLVDNTIPDLLRETANEAQPGELCRLADFCSDRGEEPKFQQLFKKTSRKLSTIISVVKAKIHDIEGRVECYECQKVMNSVKNFEKDSPLRSSAENAFMKLCIYEGLNAEECGDLSWAMFTQLNKFLYENLEPSSFCSQELECINSDLDPTPSVENDQTPVSESSICSDCEKFYSDISAIFHEQDSVTRTVAFAKKALCQNVGSLQYECNAIVDRLLPVLLHYVSNSFTPASFCSSMALCSSDLPPKFDIMKVVNVMPTNVGQVGDIKCEECVAIVGFFQNLDRDAEVQIAVEKIFNDTCALLGQEAQQCQALAAQYAPQLFEIIASELDPNTVCDLFLNCFKSFVEDDREEEDVAKPDEVVVKVDPHADVQQANVVSVDVKAGQSVVECDICRFALEVVEEIVSRNRTEQSLVEALQQVCSLLTPSARQPCEQFVSNYTPTLIRLLLQELDPEVICSELRVCNDTSNNVPETAHLQASSIGSIECELCELVLGAIDSVLDGNRTLAAIVKALDEICSILPATIRSQCVSFVSEYGPAVMELLADELDPQVVCIKIGLCNQAQVKRLVEADDKRTPQATPVCELCNQVMQLIETFLQQNRTEETVTEALQQVCSFFPNTISAECRQFVGRYSRDVINLLLQDLNATDICKKLGLCSVTGKELTTTAGDKKPSAGPICDLCKEVLQTLDSLLEKNRTVDDIEKALDQVCRLFPATIASQCRQLVGQYAPQIIDYIAEELKPEEICSLLGLCSQNNRAQETKPIATVGERKPSAGPICDLCKEVLQTLDSLLKENRTVDDIEKALDQVCRLFPATIASQCRQLVGQYAPQIIDYIAEELKPEEICSLLGLCSQNNRAQEGKPMMEEGEQKPSAGPICELCKLVLQTLDSLIKKNSTVDDIQKGLDKVCSLFPATISSQCRQLVGQYSPEIVQLLVQQLNPSDICLILDLCNQAGNVQKEAAVEGEQKPSAGPICDLCKEVLQKLDSLLEKNRTVDDIEKALDQVCRLFPATIASQCRQLVAQYAPALIDLIVEEVQPDEICSLLGLCSQGNKATGGELTTSNSEQKPSAGPICDLCKEVLQTLDSMLEKNRTVDDIETALDQVCGLFPATIASQCRQLVGQYAPQIIDYIAEELKPEEICSLLGLCSQSNSARGRELITATGEQKPSAGPICDLCKEVLQTLDSMLEKNRTVDDIEKALDQVCRLFPATISSQCRQLVAQYAPQIIDYIAEELKPEEICSLLGLCSQGHNALASTHTIEPKIVAKLEEDFECALCQMVIIEVNKLLGDNRTEAAIIRAVETVCDLLSGDLKIQCQSEVQNYGPAVIDLLQHMDDPEAVCKAVKLCLPKLPLAAGGEVESQALAVREGELCLICETLLIYVHEGLNDKATVDEVEKLLNDVCNLLPTDLTSECSLVVQQFTPLILQLLAEEMSPKVICEAIKLCPSPNSTSHPRFLGLDPCTFGPAYWCANLENAAKCDVVERCVKDFGLLIN